MVAAYHLLLASLVMRVWTTATGCSPCETALAYYKVAEEDSLLGVYNRFSTDFEKLSKYNKISSDITIPQELLIPFSCECDTHGILGHEFLYQVTAEDPVLSIISDRRFQGLSRPEWIVKATPLPGPTVFPGLIIRVPVNCSCGSGDVSPDYGVFATYVTQSNDTLDTISSKFNVTPVVVRMYNPAVSFDSLSPRTILFVPAADVNGEFARYNGGNDDAGVPVSLIVGVSVGVPIAVFLAFFCWFLVWKRKKQGHVEDDGFSVVLVSATQKTGTQPASGAPKTNVSSSSVRTAISDIGIQKSLEFSFQELSAATNNFSDLNKIGQGGYGAVYYGFLREQRLAIKRMNLQATKEFLSELTVLSRVHHSNLVQLIGFCTVESLFLVYEFVDNGTLSQQLHSSKTPALSWASRMQIALDAARGLEYIHEHTKPTYIHRDVKSTNILVDSNFHAKVADFGLTKLTETGISLTQPTRLVGTFGYMSPEYARFGDVSSSLDVYSFGVVLFEILSAQEAIIRAPAGFSFQSSQEQKGLVTLFEDVLKDHNGGQEKLKSLMDPRLEDYPLDAAWSLAKLAGACTEENPDLRPNMRTVVVALMTLSDRS